MDNAWSLTAAAMAAKPTVTTFPRTGEPAVYENEITESLSSRSPSIFQIRRRPLPADSGDHGDPGSPNSEPLLTTRRPDNATEQSAKHWYKTSISQRYKQISKRLGPTALATLVLGTITVFAALGFLNFLWFASAKNRTWRIIASTNWMTRAVSLAALALRTAISMQAVISTSMLASVALESDMILATRLASVSTMRNINNGPLLLAGFTSKAFLERGRSLPHIFLPLVLVMLVITTVLLQFTSAALLSDLSLSPIPGLSNSAILSNHFIYNTSDQSGPLIQVTRGSSWLRQPPFFPTFAEYSEPGNNTNTNVVDSGRLLRAFLPLQEQQSRYNVQDYKGIATVLDSHVICVRPELANTEIHTDGREASGFFSQPRFALVSSVAASSHAQSIQGSVDTFFETGCLVDPLTSLDAVWRITLCQITQEAGLPSEFGPSDLLDRPTYLVLNVSSGTADEWLQLGNFNYSLTYTLTDPGIRPVRNESNGEWLDLLFKDDGSIRLSLSLCYAALDSADLSVHAFSNTNRTEPVGVFDAKRMAYRYDGVRQQLGQTADGWTYGMFEDRGILELGFRSSWQPNKTRGDYVRPYNAGPGWAPYISWLLKASQFDSSGLFSDADPMDEFSRSNSTAHLSYEKSGVSASSFNNVLSDIYPDPSFSSLLQDILRNGGDIAHGLSSLITVVAGSAYYDQLPQFNGNSDIEQTMFVTVLTPQRHRGYTAVFAVAIFHLVLIAIALFLFLTRTKISRIGNAWQTIAQIRDPRTEELLYLNTLATDEEAKMWMAKTAGSKEDYRFSKYGDNAENASSTSSFLRPRGLVGIRLNNDETRTELFQHELTGDVGIESQD